MIIRKKLKCPHCEAVHSLQEVIFPTCNDRGYWKVECSSCGEIFAVPVLNPQESTYEPSYLVKERLDDNETPLDVLLASDIIEYNINLNKTSFEFDYSIAPIYRCANTGQSLEEAARDSLIHSLTNIVNANNDAINYVLASRGPDYEYLVVPLKVDCSCGDEHIATFYCPFSTTSKIPSNSASYLLADITNVDMEDELSGVFSKTEIMEFLQKLLIRWNLFAHQIVVAAPFVGHQYLKREEKLEVWNWLLSQLDPEKSIFITRTNTFSNYKKLLESEEGLNAALLEEYDLQNRLVTANTKKNDFHAKFFAGLSDNRVEVLSGSANLVKGPSMENCTFAGFKPDQFKNKYWDKLNMKVPLASPNQRHWIVARQSLDSWLCKPYQGSFIYAPTLSDESHILD